MDKIKAIFLDFDWTLFDHKTRTFNERGIKALQEAHQKGIKLIINSARTYYSLKMLNTFNLIPLDGFVVHNGGASIIDDKILYADFMDDDIKNDIINFLNEHHFSYNIMCLYDTYIKNTNPKLIEEFYSVFYEPYPLPISKYKNEQALSIQIFSSVEDDDALKDLAKKYNLIFNRFSDKNVELCQKEFLKSKGVQAIFDYLNLKKENAFAFGDDINDISMFDAVKYSVCLGNGHKIAKEHAFYVTDTIENDGLYKALKHFKIID